MTKIGQGKLIEGHTRLIADIEYADSIAKELKSRPRIVTNQLPTHFNGKKIEYLNEEEKQAFYLSQQPESTKHLLTTDPEERWSKPIENWKAVPDAKNQDEAVAKRNIDPSEVSLHRSSVQGRNNLGDSKLSSVSPEAKERAIDAFRFSKPAELTPEEIKRLTRIEPIASTPLEPEEPKKLSFWEKLFKKNEPADIKQDKFKASYKGKHLIITKE